MGVRGCGMWTADAPLWAMGRAVAQGIWAALPAGRQRVGGSPFSGAAVDWAAYLERHDLTVTVQ